MTTFLEYVVSKVLGEPVRSNGNGESFWNPCIWCGCDDGKFHSRPDLPGYTHKLGCHRCGGFGDEHDVLRWKSPSSYAERRDVILPKLRAEYDALPPAWDRAKGTTAIPGRAPSPRGRPGPCPLCAADPDEAYTDEVTAAADRLDAHLGKNLHGPFALRGLEVAVQALAVSAESGVHPFALAQHLVHRAWSRGLEREHMATCRDLGCDTRCCLLRRGWTEEEIEAYGEELRKAAAERRSNSAARRATR